MHGEWSVTISNPDQAAVPGSSVVYDGTIINNSGADLFLYTTDLSFLMEAPPESYEFELAPELLAELDPPYRRLWDALSDVHGELEAARVLAKILAVVSNCGENRVASWFVMC